MNTKKDYFEFALDNIIKFGDTDIFPFPIEKHIMFDNKADTLNLLLDIDQNFEKYITETGPTFSNMLASAGYHGFRWATQIDPIWNAYFLGIVLYISEKIEKARIEKEKNNVFSYRIKIDEQEKTVFDSNYGWKSFQEHSVKLSKNNDYEYVLTCDISNFYSNVYHHRIENSLSKLDVDDKSVEKNIMAILSKFSNTRSYGLPIGGQASRILAELLLNRTDKLLRMNQITFCRFVDDYHIFAKNEQDAYSALLYLSKIMIENEGLSLQKSKTRIVTVDEFLKTSILNIDEESSGRNIFAISLKYDPYSLTADEDYEKLKEEIAQLDILTFLTQELNKSRIHTSLMKKIINTLKFTEKSVLANAIEALLTNIENLAPVFPNIMIMFENVFNTLDENIQEKILEKIRFLINESSYIMKIELNVSYALRLLSNKNTEENEIVIQKIFKEADNEFIRRDIILIMGRWNASHWLSDLKNRFDSLTIAEKRSFIIASYKLGDEGTHWRTHHKNNFSKIDLLYRDWISNKVQIKGWELSI